MSKNNGGPAFPEVLSEFEGTGNRTTTIQRGMSLRQWYKGQVVKSFGNFMPDDPGTIDPNKLIKAVCMLADLMIAEDKIFEQEK